MVSIFSNKKIDMQKRCDRLARKGFSEKDLNKKIDKKKRAGDSKMDKWKNLRRLTKNWRKSKIILNLTRKILNTLAEIRRDFKSIYNFEWIKLRKLIRKRKVIKYGVPV